MSRHGLTRLTVEAVEFVALLVYPVVVLYDDVVVPAHHHHSLNIYIRHWELFRSYFRTWEQVVRPAF